VKYFVLSALLAGQIARCQGIRPPINKTTAPRLHIMATGAGARVSSASGRHRAGNLLPVRDPAKGKCRGQDENHRATGTPELMIMVVHADEADYHEDTGEIEARGNVHVDYRDDPGKVKPVGNVRIKAGNCRRSALGRTEVTHW